MVLASHVLGSPWEPINAKEDADIKEVPKLENWTSQIATWVKSKNFEGRGFFMAKAQQVAGREKLPGWKKPRFFFRGVCQ